MKKLILILFLFSLNAFSYERHQTHVDPELVQYSHLLLLQQVGVKEKTGHNDGIEVESYLRDVGLRKGYAWCASLQMSMYIRSCYALKINIKSLPFKVSASAVAIFNSIKKYPKTKYQAFDDDFLAWIDKNNINGHFSRIIKVIDKNLVYTVEGNTSSGTGNQSDGDGCYIRIRSITKNLSKTKRVNGLIGV